MNRVEMVMRRRVFRAFVNADPVDVSFIRDLPPVTSAGGGRVSGGTQTLAPQRGRIVQTKRRFDAGLTSGEPGLIPDSKYQLLGFHDMDVQEGDSFQWAGHVYRVQAIHPFRVESTLCAIDYDGKPNQT